MDEPEGSLNAVGQLPWRQKQHSSPRDDDGELRRLESEIKQAYVRKALHAQLAERRAEQAAEAARARLGEELSRGAAEAVLAERERLAAEERRRSAAELKVALAQQLEERREAQRQAEEEARTERLLLTRLDQAREHRERERRLLRREELAEQHLLDGLVQREFREVALSRQEELERRLAEEQLKHQRNLESRAEELKELRAQARRRREDMVRRAAEALLRARHDEGQRALLSEELQEEARLDAELEAREAELRRRREALDVAEAQRRQAEFEADCRRRFLERERQFAEAVMSQLAVSEQVARLSAEARRRCRLGHKEDLERLMSERAAAHAAELARMRRDLVEEHRREEQKQLEVRAQRMRLLEEHVENVAEFLSEGLLIGEERGLVGASRSKR